VRDLSMSDRLPSYETPDVDLSPALLMFNVGKTLTISSCCPIPGSLKAGGLQIPIGDSK
jgi:hypothetical protein